MPEIVAIFLNIALAMLKIAMFIAIGFVFFYGCRKLFPDNRWSDLAHRYLSLAVIYVTLPLLLFTKLAIRNISVLNAEYPGWFWLPVGGAALIFSGIGIGWMLSRFLPDSGRTRTLTMLMSGFQNAGYLPFAVVKGIFPNDDIMLTFISILLLGITPFLWSIAPYLLRRADGEGDESKRTKQKLPLRKMITPPFIAIILAFVALLAGLGPRLTATELGEYNLREWTQILLIPIGETTIILAMFVLGGALSRLTFRKPTHLKFLTFTLTAKLIILPAVTLLLFPLLHLWLSPLILTVLVIESCAPTATNITVQARAYTSHETQDAVAEAMLYMYIISMGTITLWLLILKLILKSTG